MNLLYPGILFAYNLFGLSKIIFKMAMNLLLITVICTKKMKKFTIFYFSEFKSRLKLYGFPDQEIDRCKLEPSFCPLIRRHTHPKGEKENVLINRKKTPF